MKGGRKKQVSACRAKKRSYFYGFSHCTTSHFRYFTVTAYFPPPLAVDSKKQYTAIADRAPKFFELNIPSMHDKNDAFVGWTIPFYVRIHARPQYNYVCSISFLCCCFQKVLVMSCCKSACYKQISKKCKKNQMICLAVRLKPPTFASAIERDAALKQCVTDLVRQT